MVVLCCRKLPQLWEIYLFIRETNEPVMAIRGLCDTGAVLYQLSYQATGSWPLCKFINYNIYCTGIAEVMGCRFESRSLKQFKVWVRNVK